MSDNSPTATTFPQLATWVVERAQRSSRQLVKDCADGIRHGMALVNELPREYRWRYTSVESFRNQVVALKGTHGDGLAEFNRLFWHDFGRNWEAYALTSYWRGMELLAPLIRSANLGELIAAAVLGRSLLELGANFLTNANNFVASVANVPDDLDRYYIGDGFEELVNKAIWGTRLTDKSNPLYQQSILTVLQRLTKNPNAAELYPTYEYLCEVAHPNVIGNTRFWSHVEAVRPDGAEIRVLSRTADAEHVQELLENVLWSAAWGSAVITNAFLLGRKSLLLLLKRTSHGS